jgi:hypothetical protein
MTGVQELEPGEKDEEVFVAHRMQSINLDDSVASDMAAVGEEFLLPVIARLSIAQRTGFRKRPKPAPNGGDAWTLPLTGTPDHTGANCTHGSSQGSPRAVEEGGSDVLEPGHQLEARQGAKRDAEEPRPSASGV